MRPNLIVTAFILSLTLLAACNQAAPAELAAQAVNGTINIVKDTQPDDAQDFGFSGDLGTFSLDNDGNDGNDLGRTATFTRPAGSYSVTESATPGWELSNLFCESSSSGDTTTTDVASATVVIDLDPGEEIFCTFTNNKVEVADTTPPVITPTVTGTLGDNGWYTGNVTVSWSVTDEESEVTATTNCGPTTISSDTPGVTLTCEATSTGGTSSRSVTVKRDATAPALSPAVSPNPVLLNGSATATPHATDALSGIASQSCDSVVTSSVGSKSVSCTATDNAGNTVSASASYTVTYAFSGFSSPVDNLPTLNTAKAGQGVPLKWRITDANGAPVTTLSNLQVGVSSLSCSTGSGSDAVEEYAAGSSGLQNLGDGYYQFNWKTPKSYAGSCKTLRLDLGEDIYHTANFQFTR